MASVTSLPKTILFGTIALIGFCACFISMFQFAVFLFRSGFVVVIHQSPGQDSTINTDAANPYLSNLVTDLLLIAAFILQHSLMACRLWKAFVRWLGLDVVERSLYILATCATLQVLMMLWKPVLQDSTLWALDTSNQAVWILFSAVGFLGWLCVIGVVMVLDYAELVGVKQVYYHAVGLEPPVQLKSREYQRLFRNYRHPVLTGLLIVLWAVPVMTASRLVLALSLTLYTFYGHGLDMQDYRYICLQHRLKKVALGSPQTHRGTRASSVSYG